MSVAKVIEIIASSKVSFDDAVKQGLVTAATTVKGISGAWVKDQRVLFSNGKITDYRVVMKVTFVLAAPAAKAARKK